MRTLGNASKLGDKRKMTKEELIALSDLNREDNIKYISSEAQGIAITLDSDRYAPNLCKLERAYICGRRKSEEQIEQLEKENAELENDYKLIDKSREHLVQEKYNLEYKIENLENKIEHHQEVINTLQKKNEELKDYRLTTLAKQQTGMSKYALNLEHKLSWYDDQLTKAKEIIKAFLDSSDLNIKHKAEEFLGEF
jgi:septal ring factor EnvC (AmiA/AmiB activator)